MNNIDLYALIAAILTTLMWAAHTVIGTQEAFSTAPRSSTQTDAINRRIERNWVQNLCAFQLITVDLFLLSIALFIIALSNRWAFEAECTLGGAVLYVLWSIAWLIQMLWLKRPLKNYLQLCQWSIFLLCAGLLYASSQQVSL